MTEVRVEWAASKRLGQWQEILEMLVAVLQLEVVDNRAGGDDNVAGGDGGNLLMGLPSQPKRQPPGSPSTGTRTISRSIAASSRFSFAPRTPCQSSTRVISHQAASPPSTSTSTKSPASDSRSRRYSTQLDVSTNFIFAPWLCQPRAST